MLSEISQMARDKCHMISLICGIWKIKETSYINKPNLTKAKMYIWKKSGRYQRGNREKGKLGKG